MAEFNYFREYFTKINELSETMDSDEAGDIPRSYKSLQVGLALLYDIASSAGAKAEDANLQATTAAASSKTNTAGITEISEKFKMLVTKEEFNPVKNIVYGAVKLVLTAFVLGVLALVFI